MIKKNQNHFRGCLIGGAIGDALGWPVEFLKIAEIKNKFGSEGITDLVCAANKKAEITDDTQMTLFTAEGLLRANTRMNSRGICCPSNVVYYAYKRWIITQGYKIKNNEEMINSGWLITVKELHKRRGPGNTCLSALLSEEMGTVNKAINDSKGCGAVMRSAPVGLYVIKPRVFQIAVEIGALTHGHPSGYLSAGAFAQLIAEIIEGNELKIAVDKMLKILKQKDNHEECTKKIQLALNMLDRNIPSSQAIPMIGEGWVGEEALAIAIYCSLKNKNDFKKALTESVNHSGDSDSTGAITGNILGAYLGVNKIPSDWIDKVELIDEIKQIADDLLSVFKEGDVWNKRYPGG